MRIGLCFSLTLLFFSSDLCLADLEEWSEPSVEWLADSSDAIAVCEIMSDRDSEPGRKYRVVEIVKPHTLLRKEQVLRAGWASGKIGDRAMIYFREKDSALVDYRRTSFAEPVELAYSIFYWGGMNSEFRNYLGIDARGMLIETPEDLIRKIKERMAISPGLPEGLDIEAVENGKRGCTVSPPWEYNSRSHDVFISIIVPPDVKKRIETERAERAMAGKFPRPATSKELAAIRLAKVLRDRNVSSFSRGAEKEMPFIEVYMVSPTGRYLCNVADEKIVVIDTTSQTVVWEGALLSYDVRPRFAMNDTLLVYSARTKGRQVVIVDLKKRTAFPLIAGRVPAGGDNLWRYEIDPSGTFISLHYTNQTPPPDRLATEVWEIESGKLLADLSDITSGLPWGMDRGIFSPQSTFLITVIEDSYVLWNWRTGEQTLRIPVAKDLYVAVPVVSPDERTVAVAHKRYRGSEPLVYIEYTHATIWDVATGKTVCTIALPAGVHTIEFFDNESLLTLGKERELYGYREPGIVRWDNKVGAGERLHYYLRHE